MSESTETVIVRDRGVADVLTALSAERIEEALAGVDALAKRLGGVPMVFHLAGLASLRLGEPGKAVEAFLAAHRAEPDLREYSAALAIVMSRVGRLVDSLYYQKLSIAATREAGIPGLVPDWIGSFAEAFKNIAEAPLLRAAEAASDGGDFAAAAGFFEQECQVAPDSAPAWRGLAEASLEDGQPLRSLAAARILVSLEPDDADRLALLGRCLTHSARFDGAMAVHRRAEALRPRDPDLAWQTIVSAAHRPCADRAELAQLMSGWGRRFVPPPGPRGLRPAFGQRKIRLGLVSAHWSESGGLAALVPVIELLDRRRIELFCYVGGQVDAALAVRTRQRADVWCDLREIDDATAAVVIGNDDLDLLIDLDGPTRCTRPGLFASRPAALALSAYGIAEAAPALGFDGVIGDGVGDHLSATGANLRIRGGLAALPSNLTPLDRPSRGARPTVFGSLAHLWQIGPETAAAWAAILAAAPDTTIVLDLRRLGGLEAAHDLAGRFGTILPPDRVLSIECGDAIGDYLSGVDLLLDPIDNPQPDDALAALALGVPVVTCRSSMPRASLLATWLEAAGLAELVAPDRAAHAQAAAALARPARCRAIADRVAAIATLELATGPARQAARLGAAIHAAVIGRGP
jgi:protein O-GlcNAc transferase